MTHMTLIELLDVVSEVQSVVLRGDGIDEDVKSSACTLQAVLSKEVLGMRVVDIEAENDELKVWVKSFDQTD